MDIKCYLAMTAAEYARATNVPKNMAWMACHFSLYGTGISNKPQSLPEGSMLILNDRVPPHKHNHKKIAEQLNQIIEENKCAFVLLDFQQKFNNETQDIAACLSQNLSVPTGVSETYAAGLDCSVFLNAPPLRASLTETTIKWPGRTLWLEIATDAETVRISESESIVEHSAIDIASAYYKNTAFRCRYVIETERNTANITIQRNFNDLTELISDAAEAGVELFIGLYQQLSSNSLSANQ